MDRGFLVERKPHPKDTASVWSILFFTYIHPYIKKGNERQLKEDDISKTWTKFQSQKLGDKMEKLWDEQNVEKGKKKSIVKLLLDCFLKKYICLGIFQLIVKILYVISTPISVGKLVNYFREGQNEITKNEAWIYGAIVIFSNSAYLFYEHHYILLKNEMGLEITTSLSSMIYRKVLRLSPSKMTEISTGKIITAITKDIIQLDVAVYYMNDLWVDLIQSFVIIYLLYLKVGSSGIVGLSSIIFILVIQVYLARKVFEKRKSANSRCDDRLQLTQEIITSIRVIKMYAWEKFFGKKIINFRKTEIRELRTLLVLKFLSSFLGSLCRKLSFLLVLLGYIWFGNSLTSEVVYYITTCFYRLSKTISHLIPQCLGSGAELIACLKRIEFILTAEEIEDTSKDNSDLIILPKVDFVSVDVGISKNPILKDVNMKLKPGLNVLIGPVGCGKSSLLKAILREYIILNGKVNIEGSISYCPQNPWLFPSSIKQNIVFGQSFNDTKYKAILEACALSFDLDSLTEGDETVLNDCGVNLSKGQQARVNIARALYKESNIYIFDDCLSALDSHVKNFIFFHSIQNYLKDKMVILATHDRKFVDKAENVIIMLDETVTYCGKPTDIPQKLTQSLESLDKVLCDSEEENDRESKEEEEEKPCNENTDLIAKICSSDKANVYHETLITGGIRWADYKKYFSFGGGFYVFFIVFAIFIIVEMCYGYSEKVLSKWVLIEENMSLNLSAAGINVSTSIKNKLYENVSTTTLRNEIFTVSRESIVENYTEVFANLEMENITSSLKSQDQRMSFIYLYSGLLLAVSLLVFVGNTMYFIFSLKISKNLHNSMITDVLGATMSFFDVNMSGNILNRFSKDLYDIDEWISFIINEAIKMVTLLTMTGILIASINNFFIIMTVILVIIFFFACHYCVKPARNLRRLCMATRSPVIGHLNATLEGLITIRAYGTQSIVVNEFDKHQDILIASHHLFEILIRCLAFSLHMLAAIYVGMIVVKFLISEAESSSNVGLAITQSFVLSNYLDWGLRQWVMLESIMTSFQRASQYTDIKQEMQTGQIVENWPVEGCIKYRNVTLKYREKNETVLKNLNFDVKPKEKIGIVGRTGAGKSSIIVTLFRLYEVEGDILIDDVNIKTLPLDFLRNHIGIIPQDPILFSGSVRKNIDPLGKYSDDDIWQALNAVNLKSAIRDLEEDVHESGLTHSVGKRQLFCLARAIVRKTKIIILDEATANMDEETDKFVHNKINELFQHCTTITVAHRLSSVMKCDRILVMDNGEIIEFENPNTLLENKDSTFFKMVHQHDNS